MKLVTSWRNIPLGVKRHLQERIADRQITAADLKKLQFWIESEPEVPDDHWYRDFGTFILAGHGPYLSTFLLPDQKPYGVKLP